MSRRRIAVGIGCLACSLAGQAFAQQQSANHGYSQPSTGGQPAYSQAVYAQHPNGSQPVYNQVGFGHHRVNSDYSRPIYAEGCGNPSCPTCGGTASCGGHHAEPSSFWTNYYRNVRWPTPFRAQDVISVTTHFDIQRENGWRMHNTVGHAMFDPQTNCLTQAGKNHIQSILRDNPSNRKVVYVLQAQNQQQTAARVQSTELAISELLPVGDLPPVYVTDRDAPGSSGAYQAAMSRALMTSVPVPRLSAQGGGSGGSGGGAAGGSGAGGGSGQ